MQIKILGSALRRSVGRMAHTGKTISVHRAQCFPKGYTLKKGIRMVLRTGYAIVVCSALLMTHKASAQWVQTNGPEGALVRCLAVSGNTLFAGLNNNGLLRSTDFGASWSATGFSQGTVWSILINGATIFAGTSKGLYRSTDSCATWALVDSGIPVIDILSFIEISDTIFAGTSSGLFLSSDNGVSWHRTGSGSSYVECLAVCSDTMFHGGSGLFRSIDLGKNWSRVDSALFARRGVDAIITKGRDIFAGSLNYSGVCRSSDNGRTWTTVISGLPDRPPASSVISLCVKDSCIFAGTYDSCLYKSIDNGTTWTKAYSKIRSARIHALAACDSFIFAAAGDAGVFRSGDNGAHWEPVNTGMRFTDVTVLSTHAGELFAGTYASGLFRTSNSGTKWVPVNSNAMDKIITSIAENESYVFSGTTSIFGGDGIFRYATGDTNWSAIISDLPDRSIDCLVANGVGNILVSTARNGVFRSINNGTTWTPADNGLPTPAFCLAISAIGTVFAGTDYGVFSTTDMGASWFYSLLNYMSGIDIAINGSEIFASTDTSGVFRSPDAGNTWLKANSGSPGKYRVEALAHCGNWVFAGTAGGGVHVFNPSNATWTAINAGLATGDSIFVRSLAADNQYLFAGTNGNGVWRRPLSEIAGEVKTAGPAIQSSADQPVIRLSSPLSPDRAAHISVSLFRPDRVSIALYATSGRKAAILTGGVFQTGTYDFAWDTRNVAAGFYLALIQIGGSSVGKNIVIMH
jgi:photosystem II stability/assembly factor-like uncharacterized protein